MEVEAPPAGRSCGGLQGEDCSVSEGCMQWLETSVGCELHADRVAILSAVATAAPDLLAAAATGSATAWRALHTRLAIAARERLGGAEVAAHAYASTAARAGDGSLRVPPGFEDHPLARRRPPPPPPAPQRRSCGQSQPPTQTVAAVARAMRGLSPQPAPAPQHRYPARDRRPAGAWYSSTASDSEGRGQRPSQP
jgi:hypothetical protein